MPIDMSQAVKAPPRKAGSRAAKAAPAQIDTRSPTERREEGLNGIGQLGQGLCLMTQQWADAAAIGQHFPPLAKALADAAAGNDMIAKPIDFLIEIGPYGAIVVAGMPLVLQLMANHKMIDASKMVGQGIVPPEILEAQMKAQVARMQTAALQEQQEAFEEARRAQEEYDRLMADRAAFPNQPRNDAESTAA